MKSLIQSIVFTAIVFAGLIGFGYFSNEDKPILAVISLVITIVGGALYLHKTSSKKCQSCKSTCYPTGMSGTKYSQYYCKNCRNTFYIETSTGKYE